MRRDQNDDRPTLEETYRLATVTSDLGLPIGDGAGAQGILAAAAWSEGDGIGKSVRRLRGIWDSLRPRKKEATALAVFLAAGLTPKEAKRRQRAQRLKLVLDRHREIESMEKRIPEHAVVLEALVARAALAGMEKPREKARAVLDGWLEDERTAPQDSDHLILWEYLRDCLSRARQALRMGMEGHTRHEREQA